jgi:SAM-dependent methyltransferase
VGTDIKSALLEKARRLNFYTRLIEHDNNQPLPFEDGVFETVYCNAAYWVSAIDGFLGELARITRPGGRVILHVKLDTMRTHVLAPYRQALGDRCLDLIDRGRRDSWPTIAGRHTWENRFTDAGLSVEQATPFVTKTHAHIWDIGLRPIAPLLVKMSEALQRGTRSVIKREWVDLFCELLKPFCDAGLDLYGGASVPTEVQYVLTPT